MELFVKEFSKQNPHQQISVQKERHVVTEEKQSKIYAEMAERSRLKNRTTRLDVDMEATGGFDELYFTSVQSVRNSSPVYKN